MTNIEASYPDFSAGELSPRMYGRFDVKVFFKGARRMENFTPQVTGPTNYRTGSYYAANTAGNNKAFLWLFRISDALSFVLEFTNQKLRFYRNNGLVEDGGSPVEVVTPFLEADLFELKFAQKGVDLYIVHPDYNPQKLTYTSATSWAIANHSPTNLTLTAGNRPSAVAFYEQRLVYGGSTNNPQTLWFSQSADEDDFTTGTEDDDGMEYTISGDGNTIRWLSATDKFLAIGTFSDVLKATGGIDDVITPSSISIKPSNSYGSANINAMARNNQVFYMQRNKLVLRSFEYDFNQDSYTAIDRNTASDHITKSGVTQLSFQEARPNVLWAVRTDGVLAGMVVEQQEGVSGWHRVVTDGEIISAISTPRSTDYDQLWLCIKRTIDGTDKYYIEYLTDAPEHPVIDDYFTGDKSADKEQWENMVFESQKEYIHLDCASTYDGTSTGTDADATMTPGAVTGTEITFTASDSVFDSGDVGREIWRKSIDGTQTGRAEITAYTSATVVTCTILEDFDSTDAIPAGEWYLTADEIIGLDHLEGKTVSVVTDGGQHPQRTVTDGVITLQDQASVVHVGLPYTGYLETNDIEAGASTGPAQTKKKMLIAVGIRFLNTLYAKFGSGYYNLRQIEQRTANMRMDRPPTLFTGDLKETYADHPVNNVSSGMTREKRIIVVQDQPFPCNVQLLVPYLNTGPT